MRLYNWRVNSEETVLDRTGRCPGSSLPSQWWEGEAQLPSTLWHEVCQEETVLCSCIYSALWNKNQILCFLEYEINNFCPYRPGFHVPDISDSSRTEHKWLKVVHVPFSSLLVKIAFTVPISVCLTNRELSIELTLSLL